MQSDQLLCAFRDDTGDNVAAYFWSDDEVYRYMNDAYFMFVRLTGGIADGSTSEVVNLTAATDTPTTALHESVMRVRTARNVTLKNRPVKVINIQDEASMDSEDYGIIYNSGADPDARGRPGYLILGEEDGYVRWHEIPDADYEIKVVVERLPLENITRGHQSFTGVREEHHYHLLKWMRHLAYRKQDADTFNLVKSDQEREDFIAYCELAKREKATRRHKVRTTSYGGL